MGVAKSGKGCGRGIQRERICAFLCAVWAPVARADRRKRRLAAIDPFVRAWRYLKALISGKLDKWEDPEIILNEAVREMKENQIKNRELAVQAITQKNNLQAEVDKEERLVAELGARKPLWRCNPAIANWPSSF